MMRSLRKLNNSHNCPSRSKRVKSITIQNESLFDNGTLLVCFFLNMNTIMYTFKGDVLVSYGHSWVSGHV